MNDREERFINSLLAGPVRPVSIQLARTTRKRIMRKLEARGYTVRVNGQWKLTKAGWNYAITELGMTPVGAIYSLPPIEDDETIDDIVATLEEAAERVQRGDSSMEWIISRSKALATWIIEPITVGLGLSVAMTMTFKITGYW